MKAEILSIGTELLLGHIVNTNASFLSERLAGLGIDVYYQATVGDNPLRLTKAVKEALKRSDIVIATGGLGPTVDDVTIETLAKFAGKKLVLNKVVLGDLKAYFRMKHVPFPEETTRQAYIPKGIKWIRNMVGTAPGLIFEINGKVIIILPGPPREMEPMFDKDIAPYLKRRFRLSSSLLSRTVKITGLAESQINRIVMDLLEMEPPTTVGIYAKLGQVELKIMSKYADERRARREIKRIEAIIHSRLGPFIFGYDDETLESTVGKLLRSKEKTISIAESCTGGLISHRLTNVSGSSAYFIAGLIAYSNRIKSDVLKVSRESLNRFGAVSPQVAEQMADGMRKLAGTDTSLAVTGIAGPSGGTKSKPVGLVYAAFSSKSKTIVREDRFKGSREEIKHQASQAALNLIRQNI